MKKIIVLGIALSAASLGTADAQSLLDLLNNRSSQQAGQPQRKAVEKINIDALKGEWKYSGAAVEFTGTDLMAVLGSSVAAPTIKQNLETYYTKAGIVPGSCALEFGEKDVYTARTATRSVEGPYVFDAQNQKVRVTYDYRELGGRNSLDGKLTFSGEKLTLTFEADKIVDIMEGLMHGMTLDQNVKDLIDLISEYKGLYIGFELEK